MVFKGSGKDWGSDATAFCFEAAPEEWKRGASLPTRHRSGNHGAITINLGKYVLYRPASRVRSGMPLTAA